MRIRYFGTQGSIGGGVHSAEFVAAFRSLAIVGTLMEFVDVYDEAAMLRAETESLAADVNIWAWNHPGAAKMRGVKVLWAIFESTRLPESFTLPLKESYDLLWVPSAWGRKILLDHGVSAQKIDVIPLGVNPNRYHPFFRQPPAAEGRPYRFLMVGKFESRKGYSELLEGFRLAFSNSTDVELVVKADYFHDFEPKRRDFKSLVESYRLKNVIPVWGELSPDQLFALYSSVDAFVFPSRAEAWGLPLIEAIACGLPALATFHSGHTEFLDVVRSLIFEIKHDLVPIVEKDFLQFWAPDGGDMGVWARVRTDSLVTGLRFFVEERDSWYRRGLQASNFIRDRFCWRRAADIAVENLRKRHLVPDQLSVKFNRLP